VPILITIGLHLVLTKKQNFTVKFEELKLCNTIVIILVLIILKTQIINFKSVVYMLNKFENIFFIEKRLIYNIIFIIIYMHLNYTAQYTVKVFFVIYLVSYLKLKPSWFFPCKNVSPYNLIIIQQHNIILVPTTQFWPLIRYLVTSFLINCIKKHKNLPSSAP